MRYGMLSQLQNESHYIDLKHLRFIATVQFAENSDLGLGVLKQYIFKVNSKTMLFK